MYAEVFNSHDCTIGISKKETVEKTFELSENSNVDIDNRGNKEELVRIEIISNLDTTIINSISNGENTIIFSLEELLTSQLMILDFKKQIYKINDNNIIDDVILDGLLALKENKITTFDFDFTGHLDVKFIFEQYQEEEKYHYVNQFMITKDNKYSQIKSYDNKIIKNRLNEINYSFNINKISLGFIDDEDEYRISYQMYNEDTLQSEYKYLIGAVFDNYKIGFNQPNDLINDNLSGSAINLITRNY